MHQPNVTYFLNNENVNVLWDVVIDEDIIKRQSREFQENILNLFRSNLKGFYDVECKKTTNLVDMNKKYILLILNHANKQIAQIAQIAQNVKPEYKKIKILDELPQKKVNELITYEEIQNDKRSQFEKDLNRRQEEFTNAMALPVPPVPKFTDNLEEGPISEIEKAIKELTSQRNYDVEQISKNNNNNLNSNTDNWLKSQETSVKNDKMNPQLSNIQNGNTNVNNSINVNNSKVKYLKIDNDLENENQVISLNKRDQLSPKKNVTWDLKPYNYSSEVSNEVRKNEAFINEIKITMEELVDEENENENENDNNNDANIFKLLKKVPTLETNDNKITVLQNEVKVLNNKLDLILELLKTKN
jgi:hypothetical protein